MAKSKDEFETSIALSLPAEPARCVREACKVIDDQFVADGVHRPLTLVRPFNKKGKLATVTNYKGKQVPLTFRVGTELAYRTVGGGNGGRGVRRVVNAYRSGSTRRVEIGCPGQACKCGSLKEAERANVVLKNFQVEIDQVHKGSKYRFYFKADITVFRRTYKGRCEPDLGIHVGEHHPRG
jgi:hypothetical protein